MGLADLWECLVAGEGAYTSPAVRRRRHLNLLSLWILPLLLARALIPAGFMLSAEAGQLQLMFCPAGVVQPLGKHHGSEHDQHQAHAEHHQGMHHEGGADHASSSHAQDNAPCPFSLAASATPSQVPYFAAATATASDERCQLLSAPTFRVGPIRTDLIRGPPSLA